MLNLKKMLRSHQLETYLLIILPVTWILLSVFFEKSVFPIMMESNNKLKIMSFFYAGSLIKIGLELLCLYIYFRIFIFFGAWAGRKIANDRNTSTLDPKRFLLSFVYLMVSIGLYNFVLILSITQLSAASSHSNITNASQLYMSMDNHIFGVYPHLWIQSSLFNSMDFLLVQTYCKLPLFFTVVLIGLLLFNKKNFREFLIAIFFVPFIAMPFWYILPAVTPDEMYRQNIFSLQSNIPTQHEYEAAITSENLKSFLKRLEIDIEKPSQNHPLVSTNPSMHVAWGAIITYFSMILWWPLGFVFIPWLLLNMLSTLYTMQHYAVDLPGGLVCAAMAIIITNRLFKFEKKYYTGKYIPLYFVNVIQADIQSLKAWWVVKNKTRKYKAY